MFPQTTSQSIHGEVSNLKGDFLFYIAIVYGLNSVVDIRVLWEDIMDILVMHWDKPWIVIKDFNAIKNSNEKIGGSTRPDSYSKDLPLYCSAPSLKYLRFMGKLFTWSNDSKGDKHITCKLDRTLVNSGWKTSLSYSLAIFLNNSISYHTPNLVDFGMVEKIRHVHFKFFNIWAYHERFLEIIKDNWEERLEGNPIYAFMTKLMILKSVLKDTNKK